MKLFHLFHNFILNLDESIKFWIMMISMKEFLLLHISIRVPNYSDEQLAAKYVQQPLRAVSNSGQK